jgi:hypothetical protein
MSVTILSETLYVLPFSRQITPKDVKEWLFFYSHGAKYQGMV